MNKINYIIIFLASINILYSSEERLNVPRESILPNFRENTIELQGINPFKAGDILPETGVELLANTLVESYLSKKIQGYLKSEEPSNSVLLLDDGKILNCGDCIQLDLNSETETHSIVFKLESVKLPHALFSAEERTFSVNLLTSNNKHQIKIETQLTKGVIIHEDGWILAPIGNLKLDDSLITFVHGIKYQVHVVSLKENIDLALLKIFKRNPEKIFPFVKLATEPTTFGDTLLVQEYLEEPYPYKKQVITENSYSPDIIQQSGAVKLNSQYELVFMHTTIDIPSLELIQILGELPSNKQNPSREINLATVNIIKE